MQLKEIESDQLITAKPADTVETAFKLMVDHDIRHLPILDGEEVVGIVSDRDLLLIVCWISAWTSLTHQSTTVGEKQVAELMSSPASVLSEDESVERAARLMLERQFGAVLLEKEGKLVGIVTETDILCCYLDDSKAFEPRPWQDLRVVDHMSKAVLVGHPTDQVMASYERMQKQRIRHFPIVKHGELVGLISDRDLRRSHGREIAVNLARNKSDPEQAYHATLADCLSRHVETVDRQATLAQAASRMVQCKIGALPVVEAGTLNGIITETDLLKAFVVHCEN